MLLQNSSQPRSFTNFVLLCIAAVFTVYLSGCSQEKTGPPKPKPRPSGDAVTVQEKPKIDPHNTIAVLETAKGTIEIEFFADNAPQTVENFLKNIRLEYYKNGQFSRVEPGNLIQAEPRFPIQETIPIEKSDQQAVRGVVAMAKAEGATASDGGQFFICLDTVILDSDYTLFGKVVKGLDVIDKVEQGDKIVSVTTRSKG